VATCQAVIPTTRRTTTATVNPASASSSTTRPAGDDDIEPVLRVVATVSPLADLVAQVGGERAHRLSRHPPCPQVGNHS